MGSIKLVFAIVMCVVVVAPLASEAAITCGQVATCLAPCLNYLKSGGVVPPACCNGVRALYSASKTTAERRTVCGCLKNAVGNMPGVKPGNGAGVPGKCGINRPYKTTLSTNCNNVS